MVAVVLTHLAMLTWASAWAGIAGAAGGGPVIPEEAVRVRILANSDSRADQAVKEQVRERVAGLIASWTMPESADEARAYIAAKLPEVQSAVADELARLGAAYGAEAELGNVPFPEKVFAGIAYPAGDYEALRITLGAGRGANWWCVLFPPLCLTAATAEDEPDGRTPAAGSEAEAAASGERPETKFLLWELLRGLIAFLKSLFS